MWEQGLSEAMVEGDVLKVLLILENVPDVDYVMCEGDLTALMICSRYGMDPIVDLLLSRGANANAVNFFGVSALHYACTYGNVEIAKKLLSAGANIERTDRDGESALNLAIVNDQISCVYLLIQQGVNIDNGDFYGHLSVLDSTLYHRKYDILSILIQSGADVNIINSKGNTPLHTAVLLDNRRGAEMLLQAGADPFLREKYRDSAVDLAQMMERKEMLELMQKYGHSTG